MVLIPELFYLALLKMLEVFREGTVSDPLIHCLEWGLVFFNILCPIEHTLMNNLKIALGRNDIPGHYLNNVLTFDLILQFR